MSPDRARPRTKIYLAITLILTLLSACSLTGVERIAAFGGEDDRDGSGIGGTGIQGLITEFGSVVVNGLRVDYDDGTAVFRDGEPVLSNALQLGQVIAIEAEGNPDNLSAERIAIRHEVLGPITSIDQATRSMTVLGQKVVLSDGALGEREVTLGQKVAVSGFRLPEGAIVATRVDAAGGDNRIHLYGDYDLADDPESGPQVGGLVIDGLTALPALKGLEVLVRGHLVGNQLKVAAIEPQPEIPFEGRLDRLSVAGFVDDDRRTLAKLRLSTIVEDLQSVTLPGGLVGRFGVFEGRWSRDRSVLDVDRQLDVGGFFQSFSEKRQDSQQDRRERIQDRSERREERQERREDRQDRGGEAGRRR